MSTRATGALGMEGRRDGSDNIVRVLSLPGATYAPSSACLALESSPHCVNCNALFARLPLMSPLFPRREVAVLHDCASALLASTNNNHSPRAKASQRSESFALDTTPPRGGFVNNIRGTSVNNFHARVSCSTLPAARASAASWKLRRNAVLTTLLMIFGTTRIKHPLLLNSVSKVIWSKLLNPLAIAARATSTPIGTSSKGGSNVPTTSPSSGSEWPPVSSSPSSPPSLPAGVWMALSVSDSPDGWRTCGTPDA